MIIFESSDFDKVELRMMDLHDFISVKNSDTELLSDSDFRCNKDVQEHLTDTIYANTPKVQKKYKRILTELGGIMCEYKVKDDELKYRVISVNFDKHRYEGKEFGFTKWYKVKI